MGWISVVGEGVNWIDPALNARRTTGIDRLMRRGTLMAEVNAPTSDSGPGVIGLRRSGGAQGMVSLQWMSGTGLVLLVTQRDQAFHATLPLPSAAPRLIVSYAWDMDRGTARLAAEDPETGDWTHAALTGPLPLFLSDFWSLSRQADAAAPGAPVRFLAVSEAVEPIGPMPGLCPDAQIGMPAGSRRLDDLKPGDLVRTADGDIVPVLAVVRRTVPALGSLAPIRLKSPACGLTRALDVLPSQRLLLAGDTVRNACGAPAAHVRARLLPAWCGARQVSQKAPLVRYAQVLLPQPDAVRCQGALLESLNIGKLCQNRAALAETGLADLPRRLLPDHDTTAVPDLSAETARAALQRHAA